MPNYLTTLWARLFGARTSQASPSTSSAPPPTASTTIQPPSSIGPSAPPASSQTSTPYATTLSSASTASVPVVLSTEKGINMFSLTTIASAIVKGETVIENAIAAVGAAVSAVSAVVAGVQKLIGYIPQLMQTFENAYATIGDSTNGAGKLAGVLGALEATAAKIAVDWNDSIKAVLANIVAQAKAAFNAVISIGKSADVGGITNTAASPVATDAALTANAATGTAAAA